MAVETHPRVVGHDPVTRRERSELNGHGAAIVWLTGISGAGKSTIAVTLERDLHARGVRTALLDGDALRTGLTSDLGFDERDRTENVRRVGEVARLMVEAGLVVIVALISPYRAGRQAVRRSVAEGEFVEVFVDTPLHIAEERDPKQLYRRARSGQISGFTGIDAPYEPPSSPEVHLDTTTVTPARSAQLIVDRLGVHGIRPSAIARRSPDRGAGGGPTAHVEESPDDLPP